MNYQKEYLNTLKMAHLLIFLSSLVSVILIVFTLILYKKWYIPRKTEWTFFKEYKSFEKSFVKYIFLTFHRNIEPVLFKSITTSGKNIIYGGFIIKYDKSKTYIKHMVFLDLTNDNKEMFNLFKKVIGKIESIIFMKYENTFIYFNIPIENQEVKKALLDLGYTKSRIYFSNHKIELVKSKLMN